MAARKLFKVSLTKDNIVFASAHFITFHGHRCETLHGHNYRTRVSVEGGLDPETAFVIDFAELKQLMKRLVDEIDHRVLLPLQNPKLQIKEEGDSVTVAYEGALRYRFPNGIARCYRFRTRRSRCWRNISPSARDWSWSGREGPPSS